METFVNLYTWPEESPTRNLQHELAPKFQRCLRSPPGHVSAARKCDLTRPGCRIAAKANATSQFAKLRHTGRRSRNAHRVRGRCNPVWSRGADAVVATLAKVHTPVSQHTAIYSRVEADAHRGGTEPNVTNEQSGATEWERRFFYCWFQPSTADVVSASAGAISEVHR